MKYKVETRFSSYYVPFLKRHIVNGSIVELNDEQYKVLNRKMNLVEIKEDIVEEVEVTNVVQTSVDDNKENHSNTGAQEDVVKADELDNDTEIKDDIVEDAIEDNQTETDDIQEEIVEVKEELAEEVKPVTNQVNYNNGNKNKAVYQKK